MAKEKKTTEPNETPQENTGAAVHPEQGVDSPEMTMPPADQEAPDTTQTPTPEPEAPAAPETPEPAPQPNPDKDTPESPATSFAQTPAELGQRKKDALDAEKASSDSDIAGAEAAMADPDSPEGKLVAKGRGILAAHPAEPTVWMTADGLGFFKEADARNHAADKQDTTVLTVTRE